MKIIDTYQTANRYPAHYRKDTSILVIHATAADTWESTKGWFMNPQSQASSHYVVDKNGDIYQMVPEIFPAWHAGTSRWKNKNDINRYSIGIELVNDSHKPYPRAQLDALLELSKDIISRHNIALDDVVRHSDISGFRGKRDPYDHFPWEAFKKDLELGQVEQLVLPSPWAKEAWDWAVENKIIGEDSDPHKFITKEEAIVMMHRLTD